MLRKLAPRCAFALILLCSPGWLLAAPADEIKTMMEAGRAADAYALGKRTPEALGDPAFDFYFGIAAIDTGHAGEGVLALERYLLNFPDNTSARLQLARGYFALGEDARAREEFEALRRLNPPADVAATIDRFLDGIRLRESRYSTSTGLYVEAGLGYDSNVNGGVVNANIFLQNLGSAVVDPVFVKNRDSFTYLGAGGYVSHPVAPGISLYGNAQGDLKLNHNDRIYDQGNLFLSGGVSVLKEKNLFRFSANHGLIMIDDDRYRTAWGGAADWQHQIDEQHAFNFGAQVARFSYVGTNSVRDADFAGLSGGYRQQFSHAWQPILSISANVGREDVLADGRDDLGRDLFGGRIGVSFTPAAKWGVSLGLLHQTSKYQAPDLILGVTRKDKYDAGDFAVSYLYTRNLSFRAEALISRNRSNIELYTFPRDLVAFKVRYDFR